MNALSVHEELQIGNLRAVKLLFERLCDSQVVVAVCGTWSGGGGEGKGKKKKKETNQKRSVKVFEILSTTSQITVVSVTCLRLRTCDWNRTLWAGNRLSCFHFFECFHCHRKETACMTASCHKATKLSWKDSLLSWGFFSHFILICNACRKWGTMYTDSWIEREKHVITLQREK